MDSRTQRLPPQNKGLASLGYAAEAWIDADAPLLKQPFRDIAPIPIVLTPGSELGGRGIHLCRELQLPDPQFEFSSESGTRRDETPPIGIPTFASDSGRNRHRLDHTPPWAGPPPESSHSGTGRFAVAGSGVIFSGSMAVLVEMQHTGDPGLQAEVRAIIEHVLADRPGVWTVSILGSQANDRWEMRILGPNAFERSYTLEGSAGEHRPEVIHVILSKMLPGKKS